MNIKSKNCILSLVVIAGLILLPAGNASQGTLLLSSLSKTESIDNFKDFDFFPDYHQEVRNVCEVKEVIKILIEKEVIKGESNSEYAEWIGKNIVIPYEMLNCQHREG